MIACLAHGINLVVFDTRKLISVSEVLSENLEVAKFFKYLSVPKAISKQHSGLGVKLGCPTR